MLHWLFWWFGLTGEEDGYSYEPVARKKGYGEFGGGG